MAAALRIDILSTPPKLDPAIPFLQYLRILDSLSLQVYYLQKRARDLVCPSPNPESSSTTKAEELLETSLILALRFCKVTLVLLPGLPSYQRRIHGAALGHREKQARVFLDQIQRYCQEEKESDNNRFNTGDQGFLSSVFGSGPCTSSSTRNDLVDGDCGVDIPQAQDSHDQALGPRPDIRVDYHTPSQHQHQLQQQQRQQQQQQRLSTTSESDNDDLFLTPESLGSPLSAEQLVPGLCVNSAFALPPPTSSFNQSRHNEVASSPDIIANAHLPNNTNTARLSWTLSLSSSSSISTSPPPPPYRNHLTDPEPTAQAIADKEHSIFSLFLPGYSHQSSENEGSSSTNNANNNDDSSSANGWDSPRYHYLNANASTSTNGHSGLYRSNVHNTIQHFSTGSSRLQGQVVIQEQDESELGEGEWSETSFSLPSRSTSSTFSDLQHPLRHVQFASSPLIHRYQNLDTDPSTSNGNSTGNSTNSSPYPSPHVIHRPALPCSASTTSTTSTVNSSPSPSLWRRWEAARELRCSATMDQLVGRLHAENRHCEVEAISKRVADRTESTLQRVFAGVYPSSTTPTITAMSRATPSTCRTSAGDQLQQVNGRALLNREGEYRRSGERIDPSITVDSRCSNTNAITNGERPTKSRSIVRTSSGQDGDLEDNGVLTSSESRSGSSPEVGRTPSPSHPSHLALGSTTVQGSYRMSNRIRVAAPNDNHPRADSSQSLSTRQGSSHMISTPYAQRHGVQTASEDSTGSSNMSWYAISTSMTSSHPVSRRVSFRSRHGSGPGSVKARAAALEATAPANLLSSSSSSSSSSSLSSSPLLVSASASPLFTAMSRAQHPFVARPTAPGPPDMSRSIDASAAGTQPFREDALGRLSRASRPLRESVLKYMTDNDDDDDGVEGRSSDGVDVDSYTGPSYVELIRVPTQSSVSSTRSSRTALANFEPDQRPRSGSKNDLENILGLNNDSANDDDVDGIDDDDDQSLQYLVVDPTLDPNEYLRWHDTEEEEEDDDDDNQVHGVGENHEQGQDQDQWDQERQPAFFEPSTLPPPIPAVHAQGWARAHLRSSATNEGISGSTKNKVKDEDRERSKGGPKRKKSSAGSSRTKRSGSLRRTSTQSHAKDPADVASSLIHEATAALMTTNTSTIQLLPSPTMHTPSPSSFFWHDDRRNSAVDPSADDTEFSTLGSPTVSSTSTVSVRHSLTSPAPSASSLSLSTRSNSTVTLPSPMRLSSSLYRTTPASAATGSRRLATARELGVVGSAPVTVQRSSASSPHYHVQQAAAAPVHETNGRRKRDPRQ